MIIEFPASSTAGTSFNINAGVNVINWFAINLIWNSTSQKPEIQCTLNLSCVAETALTLQGMNLTTSHIITVGGWNAPHPSPKLDGRAWWAVFDDWNSNIVARRGFAGFDGIDWDLEGNDEPASPWNHFSFASLEIVGTMSQHAKEAGYVVTLVPPQSYFDAESSLFSRSLLFGYANYHPSFKYHGFNAYALIYSKYGTTPQQQLPTFDIVDVQLYESWSRASYALDDKGITLATYLSGLIHTLVHGWFVDFSLDPLVQWPSQNVSVPASRLVIGFSFGSSDGSGKSVFIWPAAVGQALAQLPPELAPRGVMFWNMNIDNSPANGTKTPCAMAAGFNAFLHVRP